MAVVNADSATQFFVDFADVVGVELDRSSVEAAVQTLSPEDAKTLADAPAASIELISSAPFNDTIDAVGERIFDDRLRHSGTGRVMLVFQGRRP